MLIYLGRLGPEKNLDKIINVFNRLVKLRESARLLVVGRGSEKDKLVEQVKQLGITDLIHFTGYVPYKDVPSYLLAADIFLTALITEIHPLSVIEEMSAGLPVAGVKTSGVGDIIEH